MTDTSISIPAPATTPGGRRSRPWLAPVVWEGLLLIAATVAVAVIFLDDFHPTFTAFMSMLAPIGLLAVAVALSLRTGTPNLAAGPLAILAGAVGVSLTGNDMPLAPAMAIGVAVAGAAGLVLGLVTAALSVPAWAVTLGGAVIIEAAMFSLVDDVEQPVLLLTSVKGHLSPLWFAAFVVLTLGGGALFLIPAVRATLSATRDIAPAGRWGGIRAGSGAVIGLTGSGLIAGLAGVAYAINLNGVLVTAGWTYTTLGLGGALLGGISVFGRRGGVAGVLLATILIGAMQRIADIYVGHLWGPHLMNGIAILIGLAASRLVESLTRPAPDTRRDA